MRILVTGGEGFIGKNLISELVSQGLFVISLDIKEKSLDNKAHKHYTLNISDYASLKAITESIDVIYHLAAQSYGKGSLINPELDLLSNSLGTLNITKLAKEKQIQKIVYTSSMAIYGNPNNLDGISFEEDKPQPLSNYGITKLSGEYYIINSGIPYTIYRLYNTYGKGQDITNTSKGIVLAFMIQIVDILKYNKEKTIKITGPVDRFRDIVYIDDVVRGLCLSLTTINNDIVNLSTGIKTTVGTLINTIIKAVGANPAEFNIIDIGSLPGDQFGNIGNCNKLKKYGWSPNISLEDGLIRFYKYCKINHYDE